MPAELITSIINKNKKRFEPKVRRRKVIKPIDDKEKKSKTTTDTQEVERTTSTEASEITPDNTKDSAVSEQTNNENYLESLLLPPEEYERLVTTYPKQAKEVSRYYKRFFQKEDIFSNLSTTKVRQKRLREIEDNLKEEEKSNVKKRSILTESSSAVQVQLVGNKIVLDEKSLKVSRNSPKYVDIITDEYFEEENQERYKGHWTEEETQTFYDALSLYGTDFQKISDVMEKRDKKSILEKYKKEQRRYPEKITKYLYTT